MGDAVVITDGDAVEEVADAVADTAEAVADAVADAVGDIVDDIGDGGGHSDADLDRWVENERRLGNIDTQLDDIRTRVYQSVTADEVRSIVAEVVVPVAADIAEEVAEQVVEEAGDTSGDTDDEITIVTPDVDETPARTSLLHRIW